MKAEVQAGNDKTAKEFDKDLDAKVVNQALDLFKDQNKTIGSTSNDKLPPGFASHCIQSIEKDAVAKDSDDKKGGGSDSGTLYACVAKLHENPLDKPGATFACIAEHHENPLDRPGAIYACVAETKFRSEPAEQHEKVGQEGGSVQRAEDGNRTDPGRERNFTENPKFDKLGSKQSGDQGGMSARADAASKEANPTPGLVIIGIPGGDSSQKHSKPAG